MEQKFSDWLKIDLHIHSDFSKQTKSNDYKGIFSVDQLYNKLTSECVDIFSITDHNIINLNAYKDYYAKYNAVTDPLLFTGVELDIMGSNTSYHSLLIFNCTTFEDTKRIHGKLEGIYSEKGLHKLSRKLDFDDIISIFDHEDFFFIPHAGNTSSIIDGYKRDISSAQKMIILLQSPMEKVNEKKRQVYNEGFDCVLYEAFQNRNDFAYLEFSDNHFIDEYPCCHMGDRGTHQFYYIKGSKSYETLRLAFIDPKSRIKSKVELDAIHTPRDYVKSLNFQDNGILTTTSLEFSPHLNVIIGGRSSGKSLLMDILNRSIDTLQHNPKYDTAVENASISIRSQYDARATDKTHIKHDILQINQGDIVNYFENSKLFDLAKKAGKTDQYNTAKVSFDNIKANLTAQVSEFQIAYAALHNLDIDKKLILHNQTIQQLLNRDYQFKVNSDLITSELYNDQEFNITIGTIDRLLEETERLKGSKTMQFNDAELPVVTSFLTLMSKKKKVQALLKTRQSAQRRFVKKAELNINAANMSLSKDGQDKANATRTKDEFIKSIETHFKSFVPMITATNVLEGFSCHHTETIFLDEDSSLCIELNPEKSISEVIMEGFKGDTVNNLFNSIINLLYKDIKLKNYQDNTAESFKKKTNSQMSNLLKELDAPTDYLKYSDDTTSKSNSPGYNSEKYLKVVLNNPLNGLIIIDQPEDNLGNKFISEQLVDLIREVKFKKQIFLITHNPAIVVYGDAEAIIIAENEDNRISYTQVKLEDIESQKKICETLDGGEYIFDNRSRKYNIKKLLMEA
ncbi:MAG TPA: hypothetical protein GX707_08015 [Epulopiscium sp.]|nr:hypothetical protein [Candidatus Epulonipiscium sp.]